MSDENNMNDEKRKAFRPVNTQGKSLYTRSCARVAYAETPWNKNTFRDPENSHGTTRHDGFLKCETKNTQTVDTRPTLRTGSHTTCAAPVNGIRTAPYEVLRVPTPCTRFANRSLSCIFGHTYPRFGFTRSRTNVSRKIHDRLVNRREHTRDTRFSI